MHIKQTVIDYLHVAAILMCMQCYAVLVRYGREDLDVLGLTFRKDLFLVG